MQRLVEEYIDKIAVMKTWPDNWDTYGSDAPDHKAVDNAMAFVRLLYRYSQELNWHFDLPLVNASSLGRVCILFGGRNERRLSFYVEPDGNFYYLGSDTNGFPREGYMMMCDFTIDRYEELFRWLNGSQNDC